MIPRNLFILTSSLFLIISSSCGLNDYPYLNPPGVKISNGIDKIAYIYNRTDNDPDVFRGYELYYKIYNSDTPSDISDDDKAIYQTDEPEPSDLTAQGYKRINTVLDTDDSTTYPMIPLDYSDRDSSISISLHFENISAASQATGYAEYSGYSNKYFYRTVKEYISLGNYNYKSFKKEDLETGDSDLPSSAPNYILSLYVFSYGKSDNVYNIYSRPIYLGRFDY